MGAQLTFRLFGVMDFLNNRNVDEIVDNPDTTLQKFLDESEMINEVKFGNKKVISL